MPERTAAEILLAQCELEVAEAKADFARLDRPVAESLEVLIEKVCLRWWVKRMAKRPATKPATEDLQEQQMNRVRILAACTQRIIERSGPITSEGMQINLLGAVSDANALWGVLIECGLVTSEMRQDYLNESVAQTYQRIEDQSQKMILANAPPGRPQ